MDAAAPYAGLTPETVLDALERAGLRGDGRLLALNSYENRVYQVWLEDGTSVVAKFYRPGRWSDAQILEEHAFVDELAEHEIPAVAPLVLEGRTLAEVLRADPAGKSIDAKEFDALFDPESCYGSAPAMIERALTEWAQSLKT